MTDVPVKRGRPSAINPARMCAIINAVKDGNYFKHAAASAGVSPITARSWASRGEAAIVAVRETNPEIDAELADWLLVWPETISDSNPMWDAPAMKPFDANVWAFVIFSILLEKASGQAVARAISEIRAAGQKSWQAHAWWLERTHADLFGRQQKIEHTGSDGGPMQVQLSPEALLQRIQEIRDTKEGK